VKGSNKNRASGRGSAELGEHTMKDGQALQEEGKVQLAIT